MWQCEQCGYRNEDWDETCQRCGAQLPAEAEPAAEQPDSAAEAQAGAEVPPKAVQEVREQLAAAPPKEPTTRRGRSRALEIVAWLIVIACLIGLGVVGYIARYRGLIPALFQPAGGPAEQVEPAADGEAVEDPLAAVYEDDVAELKRFRRFGDALREAEAALAGKEIAPTVDGRPAPETLQLLGELEQLGERLLSDYVEFEDLCARYSPDDLRPYQELLRQFFVARFSSLQGLLGEAYSRDADGVNTAYVLSDRLAAALEPHDAAGAEALKAQWAEAVYDRDQFLLDLAHEEELMQLAARLEALKDVHGQYNQAFSELPPYGAHRGVLDSNARKLLELLDQLGVTLEELVVEFEEYEATLDPLERSDRMEDYVEEFTTLAREDHLFCFTETYRIYVKDKRLEHPAYHGLADRYAFVKEHWPELELDYRGVYTTYEQRWADLWAED
jgi:hypothetical protein